MRRFFAVLILLGAHIGVQAAEMAAAMKGPLSYSLEQYGMVLGVSFISGLASWFMKIRKGLVPAWSLSAVLGEMLTSVTAGLIVFWLCEWQETNQLLTMALVALAGHAGGKAIAVLEQLAQRRLSKLVDSGALDEGKS